MNTRACIHSEASGFRYHQRFEGTMDRFGLVLLDVWREACRHIEIAEAVALIAPILAQHLPLRSILVRRLDVKRSMLETVASGSIEDTPSPHDRIHELSSNKLEALLSWCRTGTIQHHSADAVASFVEGLVPDGLAGDILAGPLNAGDAVNGALLLVARPPVAFTEEHENLLLALREPFSVALENDARLRELRSFREAAEADKRSLLTRLGREDISDRIVGAESGLRSVMERVNLVAVSDVPVLIFGETGSGKEVIARAVHSRSRRSAGPFLRVNCGAIAPELIDSELFGHERGSFTGALSLRKGWFERADGGTLFLDEVGELPPAAQVRLLRILQDGSFERVGGQRQLTVDVRIVAATHRNLQALVADGLFREDLWYRLAVFPVHLPALREHLQDLPELAAHFALKAARRFGTPPRVPTPEDNALLATYPWPGNVRELQSVIERAVILGDGRGLEVARALGSGGLPSGTAPGSSASSPLLPSAPADVDSMRSAITRHIEAALTRTQGQIEGRGGAAALLEVNPHTLRARMRKLGIQWTKFRMPSP